MDVQQPTSALNTPINNNNNDILKDSIQPLEFLMDSNQQQQQQQQQQLLQYIQQQQGIPLYPVQMIPLPNNSQLQVQHQPQVISEEVVEQKPIANIENAKLPVQQKRKRKQDNPEKLVAIPVKKKITISKSNTVPYKEISNIKEESSSSSDSDSDSDDNDSEDDDEYDEKLDEQPIVINQMNIKQLSNDDVKHLRSNMYDFFKDGKKKTVENNVRFRIVNEWFYLKTENAINEELDFNFVNEKSHKSKIKTHTNKFLDRFTETNGYEIGKERSFKLSLFQNLLSTLPRCNFKILDGCSYRCDYIYSFFDEDTIKLFDKVDAIKKSTLVLLQIKSLLYDMHYEDPERFKRLLTHISNTKFLKAFRNIFREKGFEVAKAFNKYIDTDYTSYLHDLNQFIEKTNPNGADKIKKQVQNKQEVNKQYLTNQQKLYDTLVKIPEQKKESKKNVMKALTAFAKSNSTDFNHFISTMSEKDLEILSKCKKSKLQSQSCLDENQVDAIKRYATKMLEEKKSMKINN